MASYSGKLQLSVCFPFKLLLRKVFICLNVSQVNEATSKSAVCGQLPKGGYLQASEVIKIALYQGF